MPLKSDECLPIDYIQAEAGFHRSIYHIVVPRRFSFADTQNPEWFRYQTRIKEGDILDLVGEAGDFDCTCRAVSVVKGAVVLRVLREWHADKVQQSAGEAHSVALVPGSGWTVFDASGDPIGRYGDEDSAQKALADLSPVPVPEKDAA